MLKSSDMVASQQGADEAAPESSSSRQPRKPLGQRLIDAGMISEMQLALALREQKRRGRLLGEVMVDLGFISQDQMAGALASEARTEVVDVVNTAIDPDVLALVSYEFAREHRMIPLEIDDQVLTLAMADAFNVVAIDQVERETGKTTNVVCASEKAILEALERNYSHGQSILETIDILLEQDVSDGDIGSSSVSPMVRLVDQIISLGIKKRAADIHIEPDDKIIRIRFRIDGVLHSDVLVPVDLRSALAARIKLMAGMNISEKRVPQDGRIHFMYGSSEIDLRVSTLPTSHGESIVMRILDSGSMSLSLESLCFSPEDNRTFIDMMNRPYGMVLVTGPTGSGKTTTLYTALSQVDKETRSVFTLEDPIEYTLPMIRQTPIRADIGMDYATGLRALLRQDPDVILIGEIRDLETAELAVRAALTGHLVLSTLHTNTAAGVIPRLVDMGIERYLMPAALNAAIGQRLVRKLCRHCKQPVDDVDRIVDTYDIADRLPDTVQLYQGVGCDHCNHSGYSGRLAIYEMMMFDDSLHDPVIHGASTHEMEAVARENGMTFMLDDGLNKALQGETSVDEVMRVVR